MNETLKKRLMGLVVILCGLMALSLVLPKPSQEFSSDGKMRRVTLDLHESASAAVPDAVVTPVPPAIEAVHPTAEQQEATDIEPDLDGSSDATQASAVVVEPPKPKPIADTAKAAPKPTSPPPAVSHAKPTPPVTMPAKEKPKPGSEHWYVQLGAFSEVSNARQLLLTYKGKSYSGIVSPAETPKGVRYRVWIGPYSAHDAALAAQQRLIKAGAQGTAVIQN